MNMKFFVKNDDLLISALKHMFPDDISDDDGTQEIFDIFCEKFPEEYKTWSRERVGGNDGAHKTNLE